MIHKSKLQNGNLISGQTNLIFRARMLWRDMSTWLATYMSSIYAGFGNHEEISNRLYRLPLDYGNVMKLFFGDKLSEDYINHLSNYIITLQFLFNAQLAGDQNAVDEYVRQLYQNIDERAAFLAGINPFWQEDVWRSLLYNFNGLILDYSTTLLTRDFKKNIDVFDRMLILSTIIGDYFSEGIFNYLTYSGTTPVPAASLF